MMNKKILWVSPQVLQAVPGEKYRSFKSNFGGWTLNMLNEVHKYKVTIAVAMCAPVTNFEKIEYNDIIYYILPIVGKNKSISAKDCRAVVEDFLPDLIQIEGTEFGIQNEFSKLNNIKKLVSLQGVLYGYQQYQCGLIRYDDAMGLFDRAAIALSKLVLSVRSRVALRERLMLESSTLSNADYFIGRTSWDRAYSYWVNKKAPYYECSRILRSDFYDSSWKIEGVQKHSIYMSNGSSALKGLHNVIKAVALLKEEYPDIKVYVAGNSSDRPFNLLKIKTWGYPRLVRRLIKKHGLKDQIVFLGEITTNEIVHRLLRSHLYVLSSLIENSPNSLGEAMLLGVPCVAGYVGGVESMANLNEISYFRASEPEMMAWKIRQIFEDDSLAVRLSKAGRSRAQRNHDIKDCVKHQIAAYEDILKCSIEEKNHA